jgi:hypothetical protein
MVARWVVVRVRLGSSRGTGAAAAWHRWVARTLLVHEDRVSATLENEADPTLENEATGSSGF